MTRRDLIVLTLKGLLAWLLLSGLAWYSGAGLVQGLLPLVKVVIMTMTSDISPGLKLVPSTPDSSIELSAWLLKPVYINASQFIPPGTELKSSTHLLHSLVPLVIEGSILLVWPVTRWSQRWVLIAFGLLTATLVILATLPALLLGQLEISFQDAAVTGKNPRMVPWYVDWMVFCELGGRWLLAIAAAWVSIQIQRGLHLLRVPV
jgi:hypothetical protein